MKLSHTITLEKYVPALNFVVMLTHTLLLYLGYEYPYAELTEVCLGFYLIHVFSRALNFCLIHRLMIYYAYAVTVCIWVQRYCGFGLFLQPARLLMFIAGLIILFIYIIQLLWKVKRNSYSR